MVTCMVRGLTLYYTPLSPCCRSVMLCLKELELGVNMVKLDVHYKKEHLQPAFVQINPQHTVPTLTDNEFALWESRAINAYLVNKYGCSTYKERLNPSEPMRRAQLERILQFDLGSLYPSMIAYYKPQLIDQLPPNSENQVQLEKNLHLLDMHLHGKPYMIGFDFTLADICILGTLSALDAYEYDFSYHKNVHGWSSRLKDELPYYKDTMKEGVRLSRIWASSRLFSKKGKPCP